MRKLYVTTKELTGGTRLIGELSETDSGYQFKYRLGGSLPEWFLLLDEFPDVTKVYNGSDVERFIGRIIPSRNSKYLSGLLASANMTEYDEWELLKVFGLRNISPQDAFLHEHLPEGTVVYG
jgi:hypothetical protein